VGTLYEYFPNKRALLIALAELHVERAAETIGALQLRWREHSQRRPEAVVDDVVDLLIANHARYRGMHELLPAIASDAPHLASRAAGMKDELIHMLVTVFEQSDPPIAEPKVRASTIVTLCAELVHGPWLRETATDTDQWCRHIHALFRGYIREPA